MRVTLFLRVIENQKKAGRRTVNSHLFTKSGHVAHYKHNPEKYTQLVKDFIEKI